MRKANSEATRGAVECDRLAKAVGREMTALQRRGIVG
jgi:hypothetical protein